MGSRKCQTATATPAKPGELSRSFRIFATQAEAARAVVTGGVHAYASVAMAHRGYLVRMPEAPLAVVDVPSSERQPAFSAFALRKTDAALREAIDACLGEILGGRWHRDLMARYGFSDSDIDRVLEGRA